MLFTIVLSAQELEEEKEREGEPHFQTVHNEILY